MKVSSILAAAAAFCVVAANRVTTADGTILIWDEDINGENIQDAVLFGCTVISATIQDTFLVNCDLEGSIFENVQVSGSTGSHNTFTDASLEVTTMSNSDFTNCLVQSGEVDESTFESSVLSFTNSDGSVFTGCIIQGGTISNGNIENSDISASFMTEVFVRDSLLCDSELENFAIINSDFLETTFHGSLISACFIGEGLFFLDVNGAILEGPLIDVPAGFPANLTEFKASVKGTPVNVTAATVQHKNASLKTI